MNLLTNLPLIVDIYVSRKRIQKYVRPRLWSIKIIKSIHNTVPPLEVGRYIIYSGTKSRRKSRAD